jgi:hypothetical protein
MNKFLLVGIIALIGLAAACSSATQPTANTANTTKPTNTAATTAENTATAPKKDEEVPVAIKAVFPDAESITKQHKDIPKEVIADIEKDSGAKLPDTDHHSYLAFKTEGGTRKQIGAATMVKADGKDAVIIYDSKDGSPFIKEVKIDGVAADFLKQFSGKGHDDKLQIGQDLKVIGVDEKTAKAIAEAVRVDAMTMQALYGKAHSH